jgi:hypothetical protein
MMMMSNNNNNKIIDKNQLLKNIAVGIFIAFSILFLVYLVSVTIYETVIGYLPSDDKEKMEIIDKKYGNFGFNSYWLQNVFATTSKDKDDDDDYVSYTKLPDFEGKSDNRTSYQQEEADKNNDYEFVTCFNPVTKMNVTYPEGTKCSVTYDLELSSVDEDEEFEDEESRHNMYDEDDN